MPHLDTVAGDATAKSCTFYFFFLKKILFLFIFKFDTSNNIFISGLSFTLSPLDKHRVILSSNTVFMFSIQSESTGPSNMTHFYSVLSSIATYSLMILAARPSVQD